MRICIRQSNAGGGSHTLLLGGSRTRHSCLPKARIRRLSLHASVRRWMASTQKRNSCHQAGREREPGLKNHFRDDTYGIVVCRGNKSDIVPGSAVPERWLRLATFNCGLTHIAIGATGSVSLLGSEHWTSGVIRLTSMVVWAYHHAYTTSQSAQTLLLYSHKHTAPLQ